jgi:hypothetical protein
MYNRLGTRISYQIRNDDRYSLVGLGVPDRLLSHSRNT